MTEHEKYLFDLQGVLLVKNALDAAQLERINALVDENLAPLGDIANKRFGQLLARVGRVARPHRPRLAGRRNPDLVRPTVRHAQGRHSRRQPAPQFQLALCTVLMWMMSMVVGQ